jgi:hypothetical protein
MNSVCHAIRTRTHEYPYARAYEAYAIRLSRVSIGHTPYASIRAEAIGIRHMPLASEATGPHVLCIALVGMSRALVQSAYGEKRAISW